MQHQITKPSRLLNKKGELIQVGYATSPILEYRRKDVAKKCRLKEWDYYLIYNNNNAFAITVAKAMGFLLISATVIDLKLKKQKTKSIIRFAPCIKMPESSTCGDIIYHDCSVRLAITHQKNSRQIELFMKNFDCHSSLDVHLTLTKEPKESMVIATPFKENKKYFYYNQKIIGMIANGTVRVKDTCINYGTCNSFGLLDWGRGVWPYKTTWYWSAAQGKICNHIFGFNLGYGFGDNSAATENMLFFNGKANKLTNVKFHIPHKKCGKYDYMKPWLITSTDNRINMKFCPIIDRSACFSIILFSTRQHQVFGTFTGYAILDDGTGIHIDNLMGFAEQVVNKW